MHIMSPEARETNMSLHRSRKRRCCTFCRKHFQKYEHLLRHERTHTGDRPFGCGVCKRSFARLDTLSRHKKTHEHGTHQAQSDSEDFLEPQRITHVPPNEAEPEGILGWKLAPEASSLTWSGASEDIDPNTPGASALFDVSQMGLNPPMPFADTEDMLQYLFPSMSDTSNTEAPNFDPRLTESDRRVPGSAVVGADDRSPQALLELDAIIDDATLSYKSQIKRKGITCAFFNVCLALFFSQFNPSFPIIHEPTWTMKSTSPFLLLNMVAIGSLFIGTADALSKGEFLWEVAYVAASAGWHRVFEQSSSDQNSSWQIVACASLGQLYAMSSRSRKLRGISQNAHSWAFTWAQRLGMFELEEFSLDDLPDSSDSVQAKLDKWKVWATIESRHRTVQSLFVIDAYLARYSGDFPVGKHLLSPAPTAMANTIFHASTVNDWIAQVQHHWVRPRLFRDVFWSLFNDEGVTLPTECPFSMLVIFAGIQAAIIESDLTGGKGIGLLSKDEITHALTRVRTALASPKPGIDLVELHLRWHALYLDLIISTGRLQRDLCDQAQLTQHVFYTPVKFSDKVRNLSDWTRSRDGRKALLHAIVIQNLAQRLPLGLTYGHGTLAAVFAAGTIYCSYISASQYDIVVPKEINSSLVADLIDNQCHDSSAPSEVCRAFLEGESLSQGHQRLDLRQALYQIQAVLRTMSAQWGVAEEMRQVLSHWTSFGLD